MVKLDLKGFDNTSGKSNIDHQISQQIFACAICQSLLPENIPDEQKQKQHINELIQIGTCFTEAPDKKTLFKKVATHPCILSVFIGFFLMVTQIQLPEVLNVTIKNIAGANTFLAMALVGVILSGASVK
mgnify:CR=1 FL=1